MHHTVTGTLIPAESAVIHRNPLPGIKVMLSEDLGRTWDLDGQLTAWDAYGKAELGVPMTDTYPSSHDAIAYRAPHLGKLDANTLLASFWRAGSADTHVRFARLRIDS